MSAVALAVQHAIVMYYGSVRMPLLFNYEYNQNMKVNAVWVKG